MVWGSILCHATYAPPFQLQSPSMQANPSPSIEKNCTEPALGYPFPDLPGISVDKPNAYRALSVALVLNPAAGGLAGIAAVLWLLGWVLRIRLIAVVRLAGIGARVS